MPKMVSGTTHPSKERGSKAITFVAVSVGSVVGVILVAGILWYFYRQKKGDTPLPQDFQYHAFIIYNHEDRHWMKKQLLPLLEEKHHLTCCIHYKDFIPGKPIRDNMADSVNTSYKVIALFSNNFVKSNCCMYELDVAVNRLVQRRDNSLAIIRIDGADWKHLPAEVRGRCSIDYHYPQERPFWRKRLLKFLNLPEECRIQSTSKEPATGINNDENDSENLRVELNRLQSTESNASEISFLSLQPNLHQETT
ncbi:PREDICTED: toll-like receptor 6 isoform X3 [Acropora digitifera]|uniref:toll-like receptor 6 isoform X3 n=1 Tax=Acropora digitifera TaxID=70779 RepID=UPI00077A9AA0|nr:PREDICTED: toll-like receptor 6 isoform X3 [Acropora digitifera]